MGGERTGAAAPSPDEVLRIVAIASPVLRNLEITECYARLAAAMAARTGAGANWCTYATWASRQAGRTIRGEDLQDEIGRRLGLAARPLHPIRSLWRVLLRRGLLSPDSRLGRLTAELHTPFDALERASDAVARGNAKVFEEIGFEFARYLEARELEPFLEGLRLGEPPEGQRYLRQAFGRYDRLGRVDDPKARAELLVLANLEIGLHEQTRLQPQIREALDAAHATTEDLGRRVLVAVFPGARRLHAVLARPVAATVGLVARAVQRASSRLAREVVTESFMVLALPSRSLALGTHLDEPFPADLREPADPDLVELVARFEPVPPDRDDCGARDWSDLDQRLHYISHLFRAFHELPMLAEPPFTPDQVASLRRGEIPAGDL